MGQIWEPMGWVPTHRGYLKWGYRGGVPVAYAGVAGNAALYTQGVPTGGGGSVSRETLGVNRVCMDFVYGVAFIEGCFGT